MKRVRVSVISCLSSSYLLWSFHHLLQALKPGSLVCTGLTTNPYQISWTISWPIWGLSNSKTYNEKTEIEFWNLVWLGGLECSPSLLLAQRCELDLSRRGSFGGEFVGWPTFPLNQFHCRHLEHGWIMLLPPEMAGLCSYSAHLALLGHVCSLFGSTATIAKTVME